MIYKWRAAYDAGSPDSFPGKGVEKITPEQAELRRIKAENAELRLERDIFREMINEAIKWDKRKYPVTAFPSAGADL